MTEPSKQMLPVKQRDIASVGAPAVVRSHVACGFWVTTHDSVYITQYYSHITDSLWNVGMGIELLINYSSILNDVLFLCFFSSLHPVIFSEENFCFLFLLVAIHLNPICNNYTLVIAAWKPRCLSSAVQLDKPPNYTGDWKHLKRKCG